MNKLCQVFCCGGKANLVQLTLFYSTLLTLTDRQKDRQRNKYTRYAWAGGTFFQLCCCVSFLVVVEIVLGDTYLSYHLCGCVFFFAAGNGFWLHRSVFWLWQEKVLGVTSLPIIPAVPLCQFFGCGGKWFLVTQFLRKILIWFL